MDRKGAGAGMEHSPYFQRAPRVKKAMPTKEVTIHRPQPQPQAPSMSVDQLILPIISTGISLGMFYYISTKMSSSSSSTYVLFMLASAIPMVLSFVYSIVSFFRQKRQYKREMQNREEVYQGHLQNHRNELDDLQQQQAKILSQINPSPIECVKRIRERRSSLWERTPESDDFLKIRIGLGEVPFPLHIQVPSEEAYEVDPLIEQAQQIEKDYRVTSNAPVQLPLFESKVVGIVGSREGIMNMVRLIVLQLVTHHSPNELKMASFYTEEGEEQWDWMRWLPHTWDDERQIRFMAKDQENATALFEQLFSTLNIRKIYKDAEEKQQQSVPIWTFFMSASQFAEEDPLVPLLLKEADTIGACTFLFADRKEALPMQCQLIVEVGEKQATLIHTVAKGKESFDHEEYVFTPDVFPLAEAEKMARLMAPIRLKQSSSEAIPKVVTLFDLFGVKKIEELNLSEKWNKNRYPTSLPVPIGFKAGKKEVILNIHDKIDKNGHGPHGLMAGTTGSGKSEVIQTVIASLAANYHPHDMAFMLIDYKGGGMSNTFEGLPHVIATITNLEDENIIERAKVSLKAELVRRQKLFNKAGNVQHIDEYYQSDYRAKAPLPHLFIVIDEFAQLKKEQPEFMDELISIAAIGRTLGVHLLLATQKPAGVVDDKIWSNSRFRICLRVQDDADSRDMLKIPNASRINVAGRGYLQVGSDEVLDLFQSAWSGAPYMEGEQQESIEVFEVNLNGKKTAEKDESSLKEASSKRKQLDVFNEYVQKVAKDQGITSLQGPWREPLPNDLFLEELMPVKNWTAAEWNETKHWLQPIVGKVDDIQTQQQYALRINLQEGHLTVYGMPGTGKTTFVQTLALSLALTHAPKDLHLYIIDFGKMLKDFAPLPHVGAIIQEEEAEKMTRLFKFLLTELTRRKELFAEIGAKTLSSYRQSGGEHIPAIIVLLDGYLSFRNTFPDENEELELLLREGANMGMYFILTANKVMDIYEKIRSNIPSAISYELADSTDYYYAVGRLQKAPSHLPAGRAFAKGNIPPLMFQTALTSRGTTEAERTEALRQWIKMIKESWSGPKAASVPVLPEQISLKSLLMSEQSGDNQFAVGLDTETLLPHYFSLNDGPNVLVSGRMEGGVTTSLNTMLLSMAYKLSPEELTVYLIDADPTPDGIMAYRKLPHVKDIGYDVQSIERILGTVQTAISIRTANTFFLDEQVESPVLEEKPKIVVIIDNIEKLVGLMSFDNLIQSSLEEILKNNKGKDCLVLIGGESGYLSNSYDSGVSEIKKISSGFLLGTTAHDDLQLFNIRLPHHEKDKELSEGEGFFYRRKHTRMKLAYPYMGHDTAEEWVRELQTKWSGSYSSL
ncbi:S-DNA-T family DNA segregation ATPase FtsK/SpoIIIE [Bacillus fengqiuensis]|nr:S-DNA-T family DNA segregation ATPase FtsK/SpoIIIE [Bacillus fengqiuensis]